MQALPHKAEQPGDDAALIRDHQAAVWRYLRFLGCSPDQADDLTQETFLRVLDRPLEDRGPQPMRRYLYKAARSALLNARRAEPRLDELLDAEDDWRAFARDDDGRGYLAALEACLGELGDRPRRALALRYRDELARAEIAVELGVSEDGLKSMLQRAKARLRDCIERRLADGG